MDFVIAQFEQLLSASTHYGAWVPYALMGAVGLVLWWYIMRCVKLILAGQYTSLTLLPLGGALAWLAIDFTVAAPFFLMTMMIGGLIYFIQPLFKGFILVTVGLIRLMGNHKGYEGTNWGVHYYDYSTGQYHTKREKYGIYGRYHNDPDTYFDKK